MTNDGMKLTDERAAALLAGFEQYCADNESEEQIDAFINWGITQIAGLQAIVIDYQERFEIVEKTLRDLANRGSVFDLICKQISNRN